MGKVQILELSGKMKLKEVVARQKKTVGNVDNSSDRLEKLLRI